MIYITGDCHSDFRKFNTKNFPEQKELTKDDYIIICGDFGGIWNNDINSREEKYNMDLLESRSFTTLFVDGNHENFDRLNALPIKEWHGGLVHEIRPTVLHLMRGQVYDINGKKCFTFGGARSHDISGGILDKSDPDFRVKKKKLDREWISYRINHISWWKEEEPSQVEMNLGIKNLKDNDWTVDYVFTHECPTSIIKSMYSFPYELTDYLENIKQKLTYENWFFGYHHDNRIINNRDILLYGHIVDIESLKTKINEIDYER